MGQRANFVIRQNGADHLYFHNRCANYIEWELFWGPEDAIPVVSQCDRDEYLMDELWCEGGAIIDLDEKRVAIFGMEDFGCEVDYRRAVLDAMRHQWPGWSIRVAHEGVVELADFLGLPRSTCLRDQKISGFYYNSSFPMDNYLVLSEITTRRQLEIRRVSGEYLSLGKGPRGLKSARLADSHEELTWTGWGPLGGVHVNHPTMQVHHWWAQDTPDIVRRSTAAWQGWELTWLQDRYEEHISLCEGRWQVVGRDKEFIKRDLIERIRSDVDRVREYGMSFIDGQWIEVRTQQEPHFGYGYEPLTSDEKRAIFERLIQDQLIS